ncbi:LLM class flavin-dependent oxidoreductase [Peribacillus sp. FSL E2-0159]|uniref:LLM class flavin-dependent oxidoreductase n=1 Tax=Peribacillus sp. FSL E2-0159 TaxID=2975289 RepID=UPI00315A2DD1
MLSLNVLDYSPIDIGSNGREALLQTTKLAQTAEELGYKRFWVSEHHQLLGLAGSNPEMLMMHLAASTKKIRIGSGGVMLPHYSSYKVAENAKLLEALYPNRIDLGLGRAPGGNRLVTIALNEEKSQPLSYEQQIEDLKGLLTDQLPPNHRFNGLVATPIIETKPEMWILGSSTGSSSIAASNGAGFTFAHFINPFGDGLEAVKEYRNNFIPSTILEKPKVMVAVFALIAETNKQAEELVKAFDLWLLRSESANPPVYYPTLTEAAEQKYGIYEQQRIAHNRNRVVWGDPKKVKEDIEALADLYDTNEITILPNIVGFKNRKKAISLLANEFGLKE